MQSIGSRTLRGMFWAYGSYVGGRALVLVSTAILARLLAPGEFGLVALALIFMALLETVSDLGLSQALVVVDEEEVEERAETVFASSVVLGAALTAVTAALGPLAALFFDEPQLVAILPVLGANFLVRSLGTTHYALAQKRIDFRTRTAAEFADVLVRGTTGIVLALAGAGAWSLVIGYLVGTVALTVTVWILVPWRPTLRPQREHLRELLRFGGALSAIDIISAVISEIDYMFVGRVLGTAALGLYALGFRLPELLILNLSIVASEVLFPAFASIDRQKLSHAYLVSLRYTLMVSLPLTAALAVLARPIVLALFGPKWESAIASMEILSLFAFAVTVGIPAGTAYKAVGRAGILLKLALPRAALLVGSVAVFVGHGIAAVAACQAAVAGLFSVIGIVLASRLLEVRPLEIWRAVWPTLASALVAALAMLAVRHAIASPWPAVVAGGVVGAVAYLGLMWLLARETLLDLRAKARRRPAPPEDVVAAHPTDVIA